MVKSTSIKIPHRAHPVFSSIKEFRYLKEVGEGAFSKVYEVEHKPTGKKYALKDIALKDIEEGDICNLESELTVHTRLSHENIVKMIDFIITEDYLYIFLEYVENGILFRFIDDGYPINIFYIRKFFYETSVALMYMHSKDLIHRDIKPENILLTQNLGIKVCDFGWVTVSERFKMNKSMCGTAEYMAPEIIKGYPQDKAVDVWSMGILLFEMFHNRDCFSGNDHMQILQSIQRFNIKFDKNCPSDARDLIVKLLALEPQNRISLEDALNHPFMVNYTLQRGGLPESEKDKISHSTKDLIDSFLDNPRVDGLGHIDDENRYKPGLKGMQDFDLDLEAALGKKYHKQVSMSVRGNELVQDPQSPAKKMDLGMKKGDKTPVRIQSDPKQEINTFAKKLFQSEGMGLSNPVAQGVQVKVIAGDTPTRGNENRPKSKTIAEERPRMLTPDASITKQKEASAEKNSKRPIADNFINRFEDRSSPNMTSTITRTVESPMDSKAEIKPLRNPVTENLAKLNSELRGKGLQRTLTMPKGSSTVGTTKLGSEKVLKNEEPRIMLQSPTGGKKKRVSPEKVEQPAIQTEKIIE
jgi:serine/threonine protein kinase